MAQITIGLLVNGSNGFVLPLYQYQHPSGDAAAEVAALNAAGTTTATVTGVLTQPIGGAPNGILSVSATSFADNNNPRMIQMVTGQAYVEPMFLVSRALWTQEAPSGTNTATGTLVASVTSP
jgi:hypothetical protein